jgi:hypothetical protein
MRRCHTRLTHALILLHVFWIGAQAAIPFKTLDTNKLNKSIARHMGTPYRYGGTSTSGIDCSGLILAIYSDQGIHLPRTAREQFRIGERVAKERLAAGDLVFFRTKGAGVSHVGIMQKPGVFVHAGTSTGVTAARLSNSYWSSKYLGARRIASGSTYIVSGDRVGAAASDRVVLVNSYPFIDYELINIPTNQVSQPRMASVQFRTNVAGDVVLHPQISLWQRLQIAGYQRVGSLVGTDSPDLDWPDYLVKIRFNDQWGHVPGFAMGYDSRDVKVVRDDATTIDVHTVSHRRGLFLVGSGTIIHSGGFFIGKMRTHAGASLRTFRNPSWKDDVSVFAGVEQNILRRVTLLGEIDNAFGKGGWHINLGARLTLTEGAVVEYDVLSIGRDRNHIDKILKFSFSVPF